MRMTIAVLAMLVMGCGGDEAEAMVDAQQAFDLCLEQHEESYGAACDGVPDTCPSCMTCSNTFGCIVGTQGLGEACDDYVFPAMYCTHGLECSTESTCALRCEVDADCDPTMRCDRAEHMRFGGCI